MKCQPELLSKSRKKFLAILNHFLAYLGIWDRVGIMSGSGLVEIRKKPTNDKCAHKLTFSVCAEREREKQISATNNWSLARALTKASRRGR